MTEPDPDEEVFKLADTKFVGHYKHVIRLYYPCGMFEDTRDKHGEPPTLQIIASTLARHKEECGQCT